MEINITMKRKIIFAAALLAVGVTLSGCGKQTDSTKTAKDDVIKLSDKEQDKIYDKLFDINNKISIKIDISDKEIAKIQADYDTYKRKSSKSPIYRKADKVTITIGDKTYIIPDVGVRMKGNTSRKDFYNDQKGIYNMIHLKLSFDETFDDKEYYGKDAVKWTSAADKKAREKRTFAGLKALELKWNSNYDNTYIRQCYSYKMFRDYGVLAPQLTLSQISVGKDNYGVWSVSEPVDKKFIERNLPEDEWGGDLYKAGWTRSPANYTKNMTYGITNQDEGKEYNLDLKTNKKTSKNESLVNLLDVLNKDTVSKKDFEDIVDVDNWVKFTAVSYFTGNPDDLRNNYNNHFIYFSKKTGKARFIAYDYDRSLGITYAWNPDTTGMTEVSPFSENADGNSSKQSNPLYKYSILSGGYFVDKYKEELAAIASGKWLTSDNFNSMYNVVKKNYDKDTIPSRTFDNTAEDKFVLNLDGEFAYCEDRANMAVEDYFDRIKATYNSAIAQQ